MVPEPPFEEAEFVDPPAGAPSPEERVVLSLLAELSGCVSIFEDPDTSAGWPFGFCPKGSKIPSSKI